MAQPHAPRAPRKDPTIYPVEEKVGEDILQRWIAEELRPLLARWLAEQGKVALVGADQFMYWEQYNSSRRLAPDIYVLPGVKPGTRVPSWKVWEHGFGPSFALEIASRDWEKDYAGNIEAYEELGVKELVVFDPDHEQHAERVLFQVFRKLRGRGLVRVEATNGDRVRSRVLGCFLRATGEGQSLRVRLGVGPEGERLVPTDAERAESEAKRAESEAKRAESEGRRADLAEARLRALEASLRKQKKPPAR